VNLLACSHRYAVLHTFPTNQTAVNAAHIGINDTTIIAKLSPSHSEAD
jgi:hypothetical protein